MKIHLLKPHTHAGLELLPGAELDLPEDSARWLIEMGSARAVPPLAHSPSEPSVEANRDETARTGREGSPRGGNGPSETSEEPHIGRAHARTTAKD